MKTIKKIGVLSTGKLSAVWMGLFGIVAGVLYSFGGLAIDTLVTLEVISSAETPGLSFGTVLAFGALIGMPALFALYGFVVGVVGAWLFNLASKISGGLKIELED